jgi:hypothetical protein
MIYGDKPLFGCNVYFCNPNQEPKLIYSDNETMNFHNAKKISKIIENNGGLVSHETIFKNQSQNKEIENKTENNFSVADQILGEQNAEAYQIDVAQEIANLYNKTLNDYENTKNPKITNTIKLSNGNTIIFSPKCYFDDTDLINGEHKLQRKVGVKIEIKDTEGNSTPFFDIVSVTKNGLTIPRIRGDLTKVAYYYRQVENIQFKPDYSLLKEITNKIETNGEKTETRTGCKRV